MDQTKLKDWMEVVGIFALVGSLFFVGLQMKQAQEIAIAEQYQVRGIFGAEHVGSFAENEHLLEIFVDELNSAYEAGELSDSVIKDYESFGMEYVALNIVEAHKGLVTLDNYYFQYQQGFMEEEAWAAFRYRFKASFRENYMKDVYLSDPLQWRKSLQDLCNEILAEIVAETESS
jgi:hypothetical protein